MSEFLKQLQERLQATKQGLGNFASKNRQDPNIRSENRLAHLFSGLKKLNTPSLPMSALNPHGAIKPATIANALTYFFMLAAACCLTYWLMRIAQIPGVPATPASGTYKGMTLYNNQDGTTAYSLFGSKPLVTDNILLRGVVVTSRGNDGRLDGFAIFEIDGKPTNAISVGENLGKGLTLQSIGEESATLLYEGQKINFKLNKGKKEKVNNKK